MARRKATRRKAQKRITLFMPIKNQIAMAHKKLHKSYHASESETRRKRFKQQVKILSHLHQKLGFGKLLPDFESLCFFGPKPRT